MTADEVQRKLAIIGAQLGNSKKLAALLEKAAETIKLRHEDDLHQRQLAYEDTRHEQAMNEVLALMSVELNA